MSDINEKSAAIEKKKKVGIIRWNAVIPFTVVVVLGYLYFTLFFDFHMKNAMEWVGFKALGTELNVDEFRSSFLKGRIEIKRIQLTNREKPEFNSFELADIRFDLNWDALLRVKFVIEEIAVDGVQLMSKRTYPGRVAPLEPSAGPGFTEQLTKNALNKLSSENKDNVLGDIAEFLKTGKFDSQIADLKNQLGSKKTLDAITQKWSGKKSEWDGKIKSLPTQQELDSIKDRFAKIKFQDFTSLQELEVSVKQADGLIKEISEKATKVQSLKTDFDNDLKSVDQDKKEIEKQVKTDIDTLKSRFKIPKIDAASFAKALFMDYLTPYLQKFDHYKELAEKYLPPKYSRMISGEKSEKDDSEDEIQPHPRAKGMVYEFPVKNGYPLFWVQKIKMSSKSNSQTDFGDFTGLIENITSNQRQIHLPTTVNFSGDFNKAKISGINFSGLFSNINPESMVKFNFTIGSYFLNDLDLLKSNDGSISIPKTNSKFNASGEITGFKKYDLKLNNQFQEVDFKVSAQDKTVLEVLTKTIGTIKSFDVQASAQGELKDLSIDLRSSLAGDLEKAFQNLLQSKIDEANRQLQARINEEIDKLKQQFNTQIENFKKQAESEIKKVQSQIEDQKKQIEDKVILAKKDFENKIEKAKKDAEKQASDKLKQEGQKKLDELKKGLGL